LRHKYDKLARTRHLLLILNALLSIKQHFAVVFGVLGACAVAGTFQNMPEKL